jgi:hypothetical protein
VGTVSLLLRVAFSARSRSLQCDGGRRKCFSYSVVTNCFGTLIGQTEVNEESVILVRLLSCYVRNGTI